MTAAPTIVVTTTDNDLFHCTPGRRAEIVTFWWQNGEGWLRLRDPATGELFESPDVFWYEEGAPA